jgi:hypothetical protein
MSDLSQSCWHEPHSRSLGNLRSFQFIREPTQNPVFATDRDLRYPFPRPAIPRYSAMGRGRSTQSVSVLPVPRLRYDSQITAAAIQAVQVFVVALQSISRGKPEQGTMKANTLPSLLCALADGHLARCIALSIQMPAPLAHPLFVGGVHQGISSNASVLSTQWDFGRHPIVTKLAQQDGLPHRARVRATTTRKNLAGYTKERRSARWTGTLNRHRWTPQQSRGVWLGVVATTPSLCASIIPGVRE